MRPQIHPALARVWRDSGTVQIGLSPERSVVLRGVGAAEATVLRALDGTSDEQMLRTVARRAGGTAATADRLVRLLESAGVLIDAEQAPRTGVDPLAPDRASVGLLTGSLDGGAEQLQARRNSWVEVRGAGRVGAAVARLLAAAGVGRVTADDPEQVTTRDVAPGAYDRRDVGQPRDAVLARDLPAVPGDEHAQADLVVLAPAAGLAPTGTDVLLRAGVPHLQVLVTELTAVVGPLVLPGTSACLRCQHLHRTDRDPAWPRIVAQSQQHPPAVPACDVTVAAQVSALAARQVIAHIDGLDVETVNGTIEVSPGRALARRRTWHPHPACGCGWST